jgi:cell division protein FtsB
MIGIFFGGLMTKVRGGLTVLLLGSLVLALAWGGIQTWRATHHAEKSERLELEISSLKEAVLLTESLEKANAELQQELDDLLAELHNAEGGSVPLSLDIRRIINRLRYPE